MPPLTPDLLRRHPEVLAALHATKSVRNRPVFSPSTRPTAVAASAGVEAIWSNGSARKKPAFTAR